MFQFGKSVILNCAFYIFCVIYIGPLSVSQGSNSTNTSSDTTYDQLITSIFHEGSLNVESQVLDNDSITADRMVTYCSTPNSDQGFCMPLKNCSKLMKQLTNPNAKTFLQKSRCGPKKDNLENPRVCCGKYSNFKKTKISPWPDRCGYQNVTTRGRILGGRQAVLGEFPWIARLYHKDQRNVKVFGCSGFLITSKFVLTAAHCLNSENIKHLGPVYEVRLGEHDTRTKIDCDATNRTCALKIQKVGVKDIFLHPSYSNTSISHHHDIGLIYLKKAVTFTNYVSPICIIEKYDFEPFEYWLSGWGKTEKSSLSNIKMKVSVPPFPHRNCTKKYEIINVKIIGKQLCAGGKRNKDSCTGDSGGPLMIARESKHWFAAGIVSFGYGCGQEGWPGVYTNITSYNNWIRTTVQKVKGKPKSTPK